VPPSKLPGDCCCPWGNGGPQRGWECAAEGLSEGLVLLEETWSGYSLDPEPVLLRMATDPTLQTQVFFRNPRSRRSFSSFQA